SARKAGEIVIFHASRVKKNVLENACRTASFEQGRRYRTTSTIRGGGHETAALQGGDFVTEDQEAKERGKKEKTKGAGAKRGMRDVNAYSEGFSESRTPCEETCIIIGALITLFRSTIPYNFG
ncbi:hypothetical protein KI387_014244, partial [Taxus chinensis]